MNLIFGIVTAYGAKFVNVQGKAQKRHSKFLLHVL